MRSVSCGLDTPALEGNGKYVYHMPSSSVLSWPIVCNVDSTILLGGETVYFCTFKMLCQASPFWNVTKRRLVLSYRRFGTTYGSQL